MATRLYLSSAAAPTVSPAFDAGWEATGSAIRRWLDASKVGITETLAVATALNSPAGAVDALVAQYTTAPLSGNQTITGTLKGQIIVRENALAADLRAQVLVWVMKTDGTSRGTLLAMDTAALANEFATSNTNRAFPRGGAITLTSVAALDTDRIVIEVGYRKHENATNSRTGTFTAGNPSGTDLPEDETDTDTTKVPWFEFSQTLTFASPTARVSQEVAEVLVTPNTTAARVSQEVLEALVTPNTTTARVSQMALEVLRKTDAEGGSQIIIVGM